MIPQLPFVAEGSLPLPRPRRDYADLLRAVRGGDRGSQKVAAVKLGIINGARAKLSRGIWLGEDIEDVSY